MENGKMEPNASTLLALLYHLNKPILYFFPELYKPEKNIDELSQLEKEILMYIKKLNQNDKIRILAQLKALSELEKE
jgi:transcriptional regulator with XRE-family HTH domain